MIRRIRRLAAAEDVSRAGAEELAGTARRVIEQRGRLTVALSGGSTPRRMYQLLVEPPFREQIDWSKIEFFWGDERSVAPDHADSNFRMAHDELLSKLDIDAARIHRIQAERDDRDQAARDYQAEIAGVFGIDAAGPPPAFDLVFLGMGADGHTASLFPHTPALGVTDTWVTANFVPKLDTHRLTMTRTLLNKAASVVFLVAGADKAQPLSEVLEGAEDSQRLPSQLIRPEEGELSWLVDQAAAARLTGPVTDDPQS